MLTEDKAVTFNSRTKQFIGKLFICVSICLLTGFVGAWATQTSIDIWYPSLQKPSFTPPSWVFAPVWTILYLSMGVAAALVWNFGLNRTSVKTALTFFLLQLLVNAMWSIAFFALQSPLLGLIDITLLIVLLVITIFYFMRLSIPAGFILIPYLLWVGFASILNYTIWILN